jgi:hypothetical protein
VTVSVDASARRTNYMLFDGLATAISTTYTRIANFTWDDSQYSSYTNGSLTFYVDVPGARTLNVRLRNVTSATDVVEVLGIAASGFQNISGLTNPVADARLELQISMTNAGGDSPSIEGVQLAWDN